MLKDVSNVLFWILFFGAPKQKDIFQNKSLAELLLHRICLLRHGQVPLGQSFQDLSLHS